LASELRITTSDINLVKSECPSSVAQQAMAMLRLWLQEAGNKATGNVSHSKHVTCLIIYSKVLVHKIFLGYKPCHV
jgi:hypothetical protein